MTPMTRKPHRTLLNALPTRRTPGRLKTALQGCAFGLVAGGYGAWALTAIYDQIPNNLLGIVAGVPALTGLVCGAMRKSAPAYSHGSTPSRTLFKGGFTQMGSRLGLGAFMLRFGLSKGYLNKIADRNEDFTTAHSLRSAQEEKNTFEKQYPTVTTITYDSQTNVPTSDTIARDRLASAKIVLLSMDHTKQIPH